MTACTHCHATIPSGASFCVECGTPADTAQTAHGPVSDDTIAAPVPEPPTEAAPLPAPTVPAVADTASAATPAPPPSVPFLEVDPLTSTPVLRWLKSRLAAFTALWLLGEAAFFVVFGIAGIDQAAERLADSVDWGYAEESGVPGLLKAWFWIGLVWFVILVALYLVSRLHAKIAEVSVRVDGAGGCADTVMNHLDAVLRTDRPPFGYRAISVSPGGRGSHAYLETKDGLCTGLVTAVAHGPDLYLCSNTWVTLTPWTWLWLHVARALRNVRGIGPHGQAAENSARAMSLALRDATRQGVDVAHGRVPAARNASPLPPIVAERI